MFVVWCYWLFGAILLIVRLLVCYGHCCKCCWGLVAIGCSVGLVVGVFVVCCGRLVNSVVTPLPLRIHCLLGS